MKKVGIMSMQRIINYGSFLQAYGLKAVLEELGVDVRFIDYHPGRCLISDTNEASKCKRMVNKVKEALMIDTDFQNKVKFINYKRAYQKKYLPMLGIKNEYIYDTSLDTLIIGSDEVFNCIQSNSKVGFSKDLFGANSKANRLISYAASFGNTTMDKLNRFKKAEEVAGYLTRFAAVSVRDENSKQIVCSLLNKIPDKNIDPVLVYDYMKKCREIPRNLAMNKPYIILYGYSGRLSKEEAKCIELFARQHHKEILFLGGIQHCKGTFIDCSPFEVLGYFKNADCIITDTFHGTIFSIINHKPFYTIIRKSADNTYGNQEKLVDLLSTFDLLDRAKYVLNGLDEIYEAIDYKKVEMILQEERAKAYQYLKSNI